MTYSAMKCLSFYLCVYLVEKKRKLNKRSLSVLSSLFLRAIVDKVYENGKLLSKKISLFHSTEPEVRVIPKLIVTSALLVTFLL